MDHIFGDSDDIDFGSSPIISHSTKHTISPRVSSPHARLSHGITPSKRVSGPIKKSYSPGTPRTPLQVEPTLIDTTPVLSRLIDGMKPSFLPREDDIASVRIVAMSNHDYSDPLFMIRCDNTTILVGSGFGSISKAGHEYQTFPDMRLIFSEKDRIRAWILTDANIDVTQFESIFPTLGFPPIYGTREIITDFRKKIKNASFLESCRFFELFTDSSTVRRIGDIECVLVNINMTHSLGFRAGGSLFGFAHTHLISSSTGISVPLVISPGTESYLIAKEGFIPGEILSLKNGKISRNSMKFTFDTFFVDGLSIGVMAGYTLSDREQLAENGVLIFTLEEDMRARTITGHIFIDSRGFVHAYEMMYIHKEILKGIRSTYEKILTENPKIERGELVQGLRREITKYCYLLTGRTPVVMPIVIER